MASLKEIKGRIASVRSTLKITSAMKLVASAKLRKAQGAIEGMLPYQQALASTLSKLLAAGGSIPSGASYFEERPLRRVALVCVSSNTSLCGAFNANVIRASRERVAQLRADGVDVVVYSVGRKMSDAMRLSGCPSPADYHSLSDKPSYDAAASLAKGLIDDFADGRIDGVELIYNHFVSTASQRVVCETFLPMKLEAASDGASGAGDELWIFEPGRQELLDSLLPKTLRLKVYTVLLDSSAAEHAARTVAMQTASDNAEDLLQELSLEYNKGRQQKITNEILDLAGGASA